jgi:ABC-type transport system substrate-binding protein
VTALADAPEVTVARLPYDALVLLGLDTRSEAFDDVVVRTAVACALDRAQIARDVFGGVLEPAHAIVAPAKLPTQSEEGYDPCPARDLARARELRESSGRERVEAELLYAPGASGPLADLVAEAIRAAAAEASIELTPVVEQDAVQLLDRVRSRTAPAFLLAVGANLPDAAFQLASWFDTTSPFHVLGDVDPEASAALASARRKQLDDPTRDDDLRRFQRLVMESVAVVPVAYLVNVYAIHRSVCGFRSAPGDFVFWQYLSFCAET